MKSFQFENVDAAAQTVLTSLYAKSVEHIHDRYGFEYDSISTHVSERGYRVYTNDDNDRWFNIYIVNQLGDCEEYKIRKTICMNFSQFGVSRFIDVILTEPNGVLEIVNRPEHEKEPATFEENVEFCEWFTILMLLLKNVCDATK